MYLFSPSLVCYFVQLVFLDACHLTTRNPRLENVSQ